MDFEAARVANPEAIQITECTDYSYLTYIKKIKAASVETLHDYRGRNVYKIPLNSAYVLVRLYCSSEEGEEYFFDGCEFQRHDEHGFTPPIFWTSSTPEEFYNQFVHTEPYTILPVEVLSLNELKKVDPTRFYNREGRVFYRDRYGYFYFAHKQRLPNKKDHEEYARQKNNPLAIKVSYGTSVKEAQTAWFSSEEEFIAVYDLFVQDTPPTFGTPYYTVRERGYTKIAPADRKVIFRLPYFNLERELAYEEKGCRNTKSTIHCIARKWCGMFEGYKQFAEPFKNLDWVEELIKQWQVYSKKEHVELGNKRETVS